MGSFIITQRVINSNNVLYQIKENKKRQKDKLTENSFNFRIFSNFCMGLLFFETHCMKSVRIQSFFWAVFSRIRTKYGKTPNMDSIYAVALC